MLQQRSARPSPRSLPPFSYPVTFCDQLVCLQASSNGQHDVPRSEQSLAVASNTDRKLREGPTKPPVFDLTGDDDSTQAAVTPETSAAPQQQQRAPRAASPELPSCVARLLNPTGLQRQPGPFNWARDTPGPFLAGIKQPEPSFSDHDNLAAAGSEQQGPRGTKRPREADSSMEPSKLQRQGSGSELGPDGPDTSLGSQEMQRSSGAPSGPDGRSRDLADPSSLTGLHASLPSPATMSQLDALPGTLLAMTGSGCR